MDISTAGIRSRPDSFLLLYLVIMCLLSWPIWFLSGVLPRAGAGAYDWRWLVAQIGVFGPSLAALAVSSLIRKEMRSNNLRMIPALLFPLVVPGVLVAAAAPATIADLPLLPSVTCLTAAVVILLFFSPLNRCLRSPGTGALQEKPGGRWVFLSLALLPGLFLTAWLLAHIGSGGLRASVLQDGVIGSFWTVLVCFCHNLLLGGSLGEEIGWRGFLLPELLKRVNPLAASLLVAVVWGLWHLPIDLFGGFALEGAMAVLARVLYAAPLSVIFTWFYLRSRGNLLIALILHTSINVMGDLGLSRFELSALLHFALMTVVAGILVATSGIGLIRNSTAVDS